NALSTATFSGQTYLEDNTAPTLSSINLASAASTPTNADTLTYLVTFSEAVAGLTASNFSRTGTTAAIGTPTTSDSGLTWSVILSGGNLAALNGTVELDLANNTSVTDIAGNDLSTATFSGQTYVEDNTAPTLSSI